MPTDLETLLATWELWGFHDSVSTRKTPRKLTSLTWFILKPSISILRVNSSALCLGLKIMLFDFCLLRDSLLALNQSDNLSISELTRFIKVVEPKWEKNKLVSSANKTRSYKFEIWHKSLIKIKKNKGPRTEPCGTPHEISWNEDIPLNSTYWCLLQR